MPESPIEDRYSTAGHVFRRGGRASFLYPSWLGNDSPADLAISHRLKSWYLKLRLMLLQFRPSASPLLPAQASFWKALLDEHELSSLEQQELGWEKSLVHQTRQTQLGHFGQLLRTYDELNEQSSSSELFPEILLVMAKIVVETPASDPELAEHAAHLLESYHQLRQFLAKQSRRWRPHKVRLDTNDELLHYLLPFRQAWSRFRQARSAQIRCQDSTGHLALGTLPHTLAAHPCSEVQAP